MKRPAAESSLSILEKTVLTHVCLFVVASSWLFGGNIWWARIGLSVWGSLALPLTIILCSQNGSRGTSARRKCLWLIPGGLYALLVIVSTFNPSFTTGTFDDGSQVMIHTGAIHHWLPSTVDPRASAGALWFGAGAYLTAFNLALLIRRRQLCRFIFGLIAVNTLVLSVLGTIQKLSSTGFYFGHVVSPNIRYFATFIYYNHWGAYMIVSLCIAAGLVFHYAVKHSGRDLLNSPFTAAVIGVLLIAATGPISASRAATGMSAFVIAVVTIHTLRRIHTSRRRQNASGWPAITLVLCVVTLTVASVAWLANRSINQRYQETQRMLNQEGSLFTERAQLYRDTWNLATHKPVFGWGLSSYEQSFQLIRPRPIQENRQYEHSYVTTHNDWLQSLAETGFAGTGLLILTVLLPLISLRGKPIAHPMVAYPLLGLGILLSYALIEFPFANAAVVILFWTAFFTAVRYSEIEYLNLSLNNPASPK